MNVSIGGIAKTVEITSFDKLGDVKVCMLTTTADGSVGFEQLNDEVRDTIYASFPVDTASGDIASFEDGADNVPVRELKLNLEPYQNLNGYDSPWVGGAGKNKYNPSEAQVGKWINGSTGEIENANGYWVSGFIPVKSGDVIRTTNKGSARNAWYNSDKTQSTYFAYSGGGTGVTAPFDGYVVFTGQTSVIAYDGQFICTINDSDLTYEPYSNICPIYPSNGKNLLPRATGRTVYGVTFTVNDDNSITLNGTPTAVGCDCYFVGDASSNYQLLNIPTGRYLLSGGIAHTVLYVVKEGGTIVAETNGSVTVDIDSSIKYRIFLRAIQGYTHSNAKVYPMLRPVEITDSAYVPYNAIGITRAGKNLFRTPYDLGTIDPSTGKLLESADYYRVVRVKVHTGTYALSWTGTSSGAQFRYFLYDKDENFVRMVAVVGTDVRQTITITDASYISFRWLITTNLTDLQFEEGSFTSYEPYQGERYYSISDNPVYGGTLEVETGVLTVTHSYRVMDGVTTSPIGKFSSKSTSTDRNEYTTSNITTISAYGYVSGGGSNYVTDELCDEYGYWCSVAPSRRGDLPTDCYVSTLYRSTATNGTQIRIRFPLSSEINTLDKANQWLADLNTAGTPFTVVTRLRTTQTYQLTPVQVKTLLGYNNIWTDSGTVEVQYLANIGLYIQKIIGATEDDMVANQNISANKYFFVGETLYYSTSAISAGQTIVVGTNCIKTNLADALNALNS